MFRSVFLRAVTLLPKCSLMTNVVGLICLTPVAIFVPATQFKVTAASPLVASGSRSDLVNSAMYLKKAFVL